MTTFEYTSKAENETSTAISAVAHNDDSKELFVRFTNGNEVVYNGVEESTFNLFAGADSLGQFYNKHIIGNFVSYHLSGDTTLVADESHLANGGFISTITEVNDYVIGDPGFVVPSGPNPFAPPVPWEPTTTTFPIPEAPVSQWRVHWETAEGTEGSSVMFLSTSEQEAIEWFMESVEAAKRLDTTFVNHYNSIVVTAVTHYLD